MAASAAGSSAKASRSATTLERSLLLALVVAGLLGLLLRRDPRPLCRAPHRRYRRRRQPDQRARPQPARAAFGRRRFLRPARRCRSTPCSTASAALMEELRLLTDSLAHDLRSPVSRLRAAAHAAAETSDPGGTGGAARKRRPQRRCADPHPDDGARDQPLRGADRPQPVRLVRRRRARRRARRNVRPARRRARRVASNSIGRTAPVPLVRPSPAACAGAQQPHRERDPLRLGRRRDRRPRAARRASRSGSRSPTAGPAFPLDRRDEALRRFGRLDSSRSDEGAGLGLALAKSIAHLHEGELRLDDNGPGLLTTLDLPVHPPQRRAERTPAAFSTAPVTQRAHPTRVPFV